MADNINQRLDATYQKWFGPDLGVTVPTGLGGVVDEGTFLNSRPRVTFILKEVNSNEPGWSLRRLVQGEARARLQGKVARGYTWDCVGLWSYGLHRGFPPYPDEGITIADRRRIIGTGLSETSFINLRKGLGGSARAQEVRIKQAALESKALWLEELATIAPQLAVCGNTFHYVVDTLDLHKSLLLQDAGVPYYCASLDLVGRPCVLLDFWHPQFTKMPRRKSYELLGRLVNELENRKTLGSPRQGVRV